MASRQGIMEYMVLFLGWIWIQLATSRASVNFSFHIADFNNTNQRKFDGSCCDPVCANECNIFYRVCFFDSDAFNQECSTQIWEIGGDGFPDITLPLDYWITELPVKVLVYNVNMGNTELVDNYFFTLFFQSPDIGNRSSIFNGFRSYFQTRLNVVWSVSCQPDYYSRQCNVSCRDTDDCSGHYTCDRQSGRKICISGWTGNNCTVPTVSLCPSASPPPLTPTGICQAVDLVLILDGSASVNSIDPNNWHYVQTFIRSIIDRVTLGRNAYQIGIVTFGSSASLDVKLDEFTDPESFKNRVSQLPYLAQKSNLRRGLRVARMDAFAPSNGARPTAYKAAVLVYDGEKPTAEFGTLVNEALMLKNSDVEVFVVSLNYYFSRGLSTLDLVSTVASVPLSVHLLYNLDSWEGLYNTVAPSVLVNINNACIRKSSSGVSSQPPVLSGFSNGTTGNSAESDGYCSGNGFCGSFNGTCCCLSGYVGTYCEYEDDPCSHDPCNGGQCMRINSLDYECQCLPGFSGSKCEIVGGPIICSHCHACDVTSTPNPPLSQCPAVPTPCAEFYYGTKCTKFCRPVNSCAGHYGCQSDGSKVCLPGWADVSSNCTVNVGYNDSSCGSVCQNGGFCLNQFCCCPPGFSGLNCENNPSNITTPKSTGTNSLNWKALVNQSVSDLVNKLFPNIPAADSEKLIDQVSRILLGYSAQSPDLDSAPFFVSSSFPGAGKLSDYTIQLEVTDAEWENATNGNWKVKLTYYCILTDEHNNRTRIDGAQFESLSIDSNEHSVMAESIESPSEVKNDNVTTNITVVSAVLVVVVVVSILLGFAIRIVRHKTHKSRLIEMKNTDDHISTCYVGHGLYNPSLYGSMKASESVIANLYESDCTEILN